MLSEISWKLGAMRTVGDLPKLQMGMGIAGVIDDCGFSALDGGFEIFL